MTTVANVVAYLESIIPPGIAEGWDNVGLLCGDPAAACERIMTCLTVTPESAAEAVAEGAQMVVTHHPILFRPVKSIRADQGETASVWRLIRAGVAVYSPHTAFDNAPEGINDLLAERIGLVDVEALVPATGGARSKVVVFCPEADREAVLAAAFGAGAGRIGAYSECSFTSRGTGTFFGDDSTEPAVGKKGQREAVRERRVEVVCPDGGLNGVVAAIRAAHSYEEPAIDVYPLRSSARPGEGAGRVGRLRAALSLQALASRCASVLHAPALQRVGEPGRLIERVAIVCGAGDEFVPQAAARGADALVTGEARFHRVLEAETQGLALIAAGHYATERVGVEDLAARLAVAFPALVVWASRREADPLVHYSAGAQ